MALFACLDLDNLDLGGISFFLFFPLHVELGLVPIYYGVFRLSSIVCHACFSVDRALYNMLCMT